MVQVVMNWRIHSYKMTNEDFFKEYKDISTNSSYKSNRTCGFSDTAGFTIESKYSSHDFGVNASNSNVNVYPSAYHNPMRSAICITKDGSIAYYRPNQFFFRQLLLVLKIFYFVQKFLFHHVNKLPN